MRLTYCCALVAAASLMSCQDSTTTLLEGPTGECDLTLDNLDGSVWVMLEAMPDQTERNNPKARMKWFTEDGVQKVKYTVASLGNVYTYQCVKHGEGDDAELRCAEEARVQDWCQALEVWQERACSVDKLADYGRIDLPPDEVLAQIEEAKKTVAKYRGGEDWQQFALNNNNLGNKLQGLLDAKVDSRRCRLRVTDMYMTIYNGNQVVDSNPVGTNPFVREDEEEYLWEHCSDGYHLVDLDAPDPPKDLSTIPHVLDRFHSFPSTIHYHYLGPDADLKAYRAEDGCTYSMDTYTMWRPKEKGVAVTPDDRGRLRWYASHHWTDLQGENVAVYHMARYKQCDGGERELIDVLCNAAKFQ